MHRAHGEKRAVAGDTVDVVSKSFLSEADQEAFTDEALTGSVV